MDLRCENNIKFGEVTSDFIEVKCRSRRCGHRAGVVIIHRFGHDGELRETLQFKEPQEKGV